jgi:prepilin-type N-terminal cleavage/methylation domain-containing protein
MQGAALMTRVHDVRGFTIIELVLVVALIAIVSAMAVPLVLSSSAQLRLSGAARQVERELQSARMKAVRANRVMRLRFNCPAAGEYRAVELLGTVSAPAVDDDDARAAARCSVTNYPFPDLDMEFFAVPNSDGPVQTLPPDVTFAAVQTIDFWPDGSAHIGGTGVPLPMAGITLQVHHAKLTAAADRQITVNGLGKITLVQ